MGKVVVKYNRLPEVIRRLGDGLEEVVGSSADDLADSIRPTERKGPSGLIKSTTKTRSKQGTHAVVGVGFRGGWAFYARFWEFGTARPNAFGIIVPAEHKVRDGAFKFEPIFEREVADAVRRACGGR